MSIQTIRGIYDAFEKGDVPTALAQMHQSIEWREAENFIYADRNPYIGPQAVLEGVFMRLGSDWEAFTVTPEEWLDAGDRVVARHLYRDIQGHGQGSAGSVRARLEPGRIQGGAVSTVHRHETIRRRHIWYMT